MASRARSKKRNRGCWTMFMTFVVPPLISFVLVALLRRKRERWDIEAGRPVRITGGLRGTLPVEIPLPADPVSQSHAAAAAESVAAAPADVSDAPKGIPTTSAAVIEAANDAAQMVSEEVHMDDLTVIEGIGPKIAALLNQNSIHSFQQLAGATQYKLRALLDSNRLRFIDPGSWAEQARLAAEGKTDELAALQKALTAGRRSPKEP
jgi:predicted flap endonuclease-1-like 5' DNA nuclease